MYSGYYYPLQMTRHQNRYLGAIDASTVSCLQCTFILKIGHGLCSVTSLLTDSRVDSARSCRPAWHYWCVRYIVRACSSCSGCLRSLSSGTENCLLCLWGWCFRTFLSRIWSEVQTSECSIPGHTGSGSARSKVPRHPPRPPHHTHSCLLLETTCCWYDSRWLSLGC